MNLLQSLLSPRRRSTPLTWDDYQMLLADSPFPAGMSQTLVGSHEEIEQTYDGLANGAYRQNGVVFACIMARILLFRQARFRLQDVVDGEPGELGAEPPELASPEPGRTLGDLLARALLDTDLAGNAFLVRRPGGRIRRLRPDWVTLVHGSNGDPDTALVDVDADFLGVIYHPGGRASGSDPVSFTRDVVAHFAPVPDPTMPIRGMSWVLAVLREVMADSAATDHKGRYFEKGATPNLALRLTEPDPVKWAEQVRMFKQEYSGADNAYKWLFLNPATDIVPIGSDLRQIDFKQVQGAGETRIAAAARVPPVIVGLSEGLQAATYSNYGQARRAFADGTMAPLWADMADSLASVVAVPAGKRLWYDAKGIPFLQEDRKDEAEVQNLQAAQINQLITAGFRADAVIDAVTSGDQRRLVGQHTGLFSVQLHPPGTEAPPTAPPSPARDLALALARAIEP